MTTAKVNQTNCRPLDVITNGDEAFSLLPHQDNPALGPVVQITVQLPVGSLGGRFI